MTTPYPSKVTIAKALMARRLFPRQPPPDDVIDRTWDAVPPSVRTGYLQDAAVVLALFPPGPDQ